jgi:hypothetical protein
MIQLSDAGRPRQTAPCFARGLVSIITITPLKRALRFALAMALVTAAPDVPQRLRASEAWRSISTVHFTVLYRPGMEDLGVLAADCAEEAYAGISTVLSHDMTRAISIDVWPAHQGPDSAGAGQPGADFKSGLLLKDNYRIGVTYPGSIPAFKRSLAHKITHAFQHDMLADEVLPIPGIRAMNVPAWFAEAMALYISGLQSGVGFQSVPEICACGGPGLYSLTGFTGYSLFQSPAEGPGFISFLDATYGRASIGEVIRDARDAGGFTDALRICAGKEYPALMLDMDAYLRKRTGATSTIPDGPSTMVIEGVTGSDRPFNIMPALSPDGTRIAYLAAGQGSPVLRIALLIGQLNDDHGAPRVAAIRDVATGTGPLCAMDNRITWSGDGTMIMLSGRMYGSETIFFIDSASGSTRSALRFPFSGVLSPSLSRNDEYIAFSGIATVSPDIYLYSRTAGTIKRITDDAYTDRDPVMMPDNTGVIFATNRDKSGSITRESYDIVWQDIKTGNREILVSNGAVNIQPAISPDGKHLVYVSAEKGQFDLYSLDLATRKIARLTDSGSGSLYPSLSFTGSRLTYVKYNGQGSDVIMRDLSLTGLVK